MSSGTPSENDLRVTKTLEAIDTSFRALVLEGGYESVTVKALCERARINKKTFYRYYETLDDLLAEVMSNYAYAWRQRTNHLRVPDDLDEVVREFFRFGAEQDAFFDAITCNSAWDRIQAQMQDEASGEVAENIPEDWLPMRWHVFYAFQASAVLAMYRTWAPNKSAIPVEEIADLAATLVCRGAQEIIGIRKIVCRFIAMVYVTVSIKAWPMPHQTFSLYKKRNRTLPTVYTNGASLYTVGRVS